MDTSIGVGQNSITFTSIASASIQRYHTARFVSNALSGVSSITAQTWTYNFAALETLANANWPVNGASQPVRITCYVWRPSTQTKVGDILDGNSASTVSEGANNVETSQHTTFTGSLVSSVSDGDVIVFEVWFEITQSQAIAFTDTFYFDGTTVTAATGTTVSNHASFIETPQNLTFGTAVIATRLFLHATTNALSNLPTTEQSSLTADKTVDAVTVNRTLSPTIGTSQTSLAATTLAQTAIQNLYFSRFVTDTLSGITSIIAGNWNYNFALKTSSGSANFPTSGSTLAPVRVTIYVWRPGTGKVGDIFDGDSIASVVELVDSISEYSNYTQLTGSSVTVQNGDVICFEVWFKVTQTTATAFTDTFYYDGTTITIAPNTAVTNHATYIEAPQALNFGAAPTAYNRALPTETTSISETLARLAAHPRTIATETTTVSETLARQAINSRALTTETTTVSESLVRQAAHPRSMSVETIPITDSVTTVVTTGAVNYVRTLPTETVSISETLTKTLTTARALTTETVTIGETNTRLFTGIRVLPNETVAISESSQTVKAFTRAIATQTTTVSESLVRAFNGVRLLPAETVTVTAGTLTRAYNAMRSLLTETTAISETLARLATNIRALTIETVTITSGTLARMLGASRQIAAQTVVISETIARLFTGTRILATQTTTISDSVATLYTPAPPAGTFERQMPLENTAITESLNRVVTNSRALSPETIIASESLGRVYGVSRLLATQTTAISESLLRVYGSVRLLPAEVVSVTDISLSRLYTGIRTVQETILTSDGVIRSYNAMRTLNLQTVSISDSLATLVGFATNAFVRVLLETVSITEALERMFHGSRTITETVQITDRLETPAPVISIPAAPTIPPERVETVGRNNLRPFHINQDLLPYPERTSGDSTRTSDKDEFQGPEAKGSRHATGPAKNIFRNIVARLRSRKGENRNPDLE